jgi:hypothetical protein
MRSGIPVPLKNSLKIDNDRLIKLTCSWYLQSKSATCRLLGSVDFGWFAHCMCVLRIFDSTSRSYLWWLNMTVSVDSQLEAVNWSIVLHYGPLFINFDLHSWYGYEIRKSCNIDSIGVIGELQFQSLLSRYHR